MTKDKQDIILEATLHKHETLPALAALTGLSIDGVLAEIDALNARGVYFDVISRGPSLRACRERTAAAVLKAIEVNAA
jgi:hypothetical protein